MRHMVNSAWIGVCARELARFERCLSRLPDTQEQYLLNLLRRNATTWFGERHRFGRIRSVADYQKQVPITGYEALCPISRISQAGGAVF